MRVLAVIHGLRRGGAQEATLEMLKLLKTRHTEINILICESAERTFRSEIDDLDIPTFSVRGKRVAGYPDLAVENHAELIKSSDLVWITDIEYLAAPRIKKIKKDLPIIAHLHSYAAACPIWSAFYGMRETCTVNCSASLGRFARCKQLSQQYLADCDPRKLKKIRTKLLQLPNLAKNYVDFHAWPMNERIIEGIDGFVAVSSYTRDLVRIHLPQLDHVPIEVIPNPVIVHEPAFAPKTQDNQGRTILYASGSIIEKGPHIALYAVRKLLDEGSTEFALTMLGTRDSVWIKNIVKRLGIEKYVNLSGRLPSRKQVFALMADSTAALMPSLWPEPFGRVPVEANLSGTPAIVSNRGGLPDTIVDKVTGLVTEPSVDAVAKALKEALQRNWDRESIARIAKERFNQIRTVDSLVHFLESFV